MCHYISNYEMLKYFKFFLKKIKESNHNFFKELNHGFKVVKRTILKFSNNLKG